MALLELYLLMIENSSKKSLRLQSLSSLGCQISRLLQDQQDAKFTGEVTAVVLSSLQQLGGEERAKVLYGVVETANQEWESKQHDSLGNHIAPINV